MYNALYIYTYMCIYIYYSKNIYYMYVCISVVLYVGNCTLILSLYKNLGSPARCFASGLGSLGAAGSLKLCLLVCNPI